QRTLENWSADPNPLVPFPEGEGETGKAFPPSYPPHPLSQGKGGTECGRFSSVAPIYSFISRGSCGSFVQAWRVSVGRCEPAFVGFCSWRSTFFREAL